MNRFKMEMEALSENEGFARVVVAAFMTQLDPLLEEMDDVKTAVSEAVTNCIIHGYQGLEQRKMRIHMECFRCANELYVLIEDFGVGIENISQAMEPLFTTKPDMERSGMGFAFMEAFMDTVEVESSPGKGTRVYMEKEIR